MVCEAAPAGHGGYWRVLTGFCGIYRMVRSGTCESSTDRVLCEMLPCAKRHLQVLAGTDGELCDLLYGANWFMWVMTSTDRVLGKMLSCARHHLRVLAVTDQVL